MLKCQILTYNLTWVDTFNNLSKVTRGTIFHPNFIFYALIVTHSKITPNRQIIFDFILHKFFSPLFNESEWDKKNRHNFHERQIFFFSLALLLLYTAIYFSHLNNDNKQHNVITFRRWRRAYEEPYQCKFENIREICVNECVTYIFGWYDKDNEV